MANSVSVPVDHLTTRQLLVAMHKQQVKIIAQLTQMENTMSELSESVDALKTAVDGVAQRILPQVETLEAALSAAQAQLASALADDEQAAAVLADANQATADIRSEVDRLNALGTDPSTPVDTDPPVDEPVEPPVDEA